MCLYLLCVCVSDQVLLIDLTDVILAYNFINFIAIFGSQTLWYFLYLSLYI